MHEDDAAELEHIRRWVRPDFERFLRPDWERYVTPAGRERRLRQLAEYKAAFEPWQVRRREQDIEREEEAALERKFTELRRERAERERAWEAECAARKARADAAWERFMATLARYLAQQRVARKYSPDQPRVPAGSPDGGQWTSGDAIDGTDPQLSADPAATRVAQYSTGTLIGQSRVRGGGWMCFYKFSFGTIMAPGTTNLGCPTWMPAAGVSHGKLIANDN